MADSEALNKCKQSSSSIVDYNARFKALAFGVQQHEDDVILKYLSGLHLYIQDECINIDGWSQVKTLQDKMHMAIIGADRATERAALPAKGQKHKIYQHPNETVTPVHLQPPKTVPVAIPMENNAVTAKEGDQQSPFAAIRSICIKKGLCFKCIKTFDATTHMVNGKHKCPNGNASLAEKLALLNPNEDKKPKSRVHQIAAMNFEDTVEVQDELALQEFGEEEKATVDWLLKEYLSGLSEPSYPFPLGKKGHGECLLCQIGS